MADITPASRGIDHSGMTVSEMDWAENLATFGGDILYRVGRLNAQGLRSKRKEDWTADHIEVPNALRFMETSMSPLQLESYAHQLPQSRKELPPKHSDNGGQHSAVREDARLAAAEQQNHLRTCPAVSPNKSVSFPRKISRAQP
jgi:hypothetical protein